MQASPRNKNDSRMPRTTSKSRGAVTSRASAAAVAAPIAPKKGKKKASRKAKTGEHREDQNEDESNDDEEYEVESIVDMKSKGFDAVDKVEHHSFLVKWVGFDVPTWEPEEYLPKNLVAAFRRQRAGAQNANSKAASEADKSPPPTQIPATLIVCAKCNEGPEGLGRSCERCKRPMHHFCATEVCVSLDLANEKGEKLLEFPNDACFCSSACYNNRARSARATATKRKSVEPHDTDSSEWEDDIEAKKPRTLPPKPVTKKSQPRPRKSKTTPSSTSAAVDSRPPPPKAQPGADRDPLVGKMVAFCAEQEDWMLDKVYKAVKSFFISGRVFRPKRTIGERVPDDVYEVRWSHTDFQTTKHVHRLKRAVVERGVHNYATVSGGVLNTASWRSLCRVSEDEAWNMDKSLDDYEILDGSSRLLETRQMLPENLEQVEQLKSLDFQASRHMDEPPDLYITEDGTTETRLHKKHEDRFASASSSFFAYLPLSFWKKVVFETNAYAGESKSAAITLEELMQWLGIMFYMTLVDKGEYSNYWGDQVESQIFGVSGIGLESVMTLKRFKFIRKNLCFRHDVTSQELKQDPVARIRPLINMLKHTSPLYVALGRNIAVDESSVACRSKYGRHLIVYNSSKPTGKFHFKIYACCCATTWLMVGFRLHCASTMDDRLQGVVSETHSREFEGRLQYSSEIRKHVLEVTRPLHGSKRIVNTDNFYTSVTLLLSLRDVGLYGRGTIRENSKHFPKAHMFHKRANEPRGSYMQGVSASGKIVAASWMDGNAVNIISNADSSDQVQVTRLIGKESMAFPAPRCVAEYNQHMQGVDRMDQLRAKYSLADGHSFKKWHKKLAMAFIDMARCNAYVTRCLATSDKPRGRNPHMVFMVELASELISGRWKEGAEEDGMFFADAPSTTQATMSSPRPHSVPPSPSIPTCDFVLSSAQFPTATRGKRGCRVCIFEGRYETVKTNYCIKHNVCLCTNTYPTTPSLADVVCPHPDWSCWRKYHEFYLPMGLFNDKGRIKRSSTLHKTKRALSMAVENTVESPATLIVPPFVSAIHEEAEVPEPIEVESPAPTATPSMSIVSSASTDYM